MDEEQTTPELEIISNQEVVNDKRRRNEAI